MAINGFVRKLGKTGKQTKNKPKQRKLKQKLIYQIKMC